MPLCFGNDLNIRTVDYRQIVPARYHDKRQPVLAGRFNDAVGLAEGVDRKASNHNSAAPG